MILREKVEVPGSSQIIPVILDRTSVPWKSRRSSTHRIRRARNPSSHGSGRHRAAANFCKFEPVERPGPVCGGGSFLGMRGIFVTGTDTGVGKTVVSAALMYVYPHARYWKPVQTGIETDDDTAEVLRLTGRGPESARSEGIRLPEPVSPHLAAQKAGMRIELEPLIEWIADSEEGWMVEGAGGVLVPLNDTQTMAHLMVRLILPVVVAARSGLGTINHTLLTIRCYGSVRCTWRVRRWRTFNSANRAAIERYGKIVVLGEMPRFEPLTASALSNWSLQYLDPDRSLQEFFDELIDRDRACLWHPYTQMLTQPDPLPVARAEGVYLYTEDGRHAGWHFVLVGEYSWAFAPEAERSSGGAGSRAGTCALRGLHASPCGGTGRASA